MIKKLLFDRHHFACRGDVWIADGEYEIRTSEIEKIGPVFVADKPWERCHLNWLTVTEDNGKFRMWYEAFSNPADDFGCRLCMPKATTCSAGKSRIWAYANLREAKRTISSLIIR